MAEPTEGPQGAPTEDYEPQVQIFDKRAVALGLIVSALAMLVALVYRLRVDPNWVRRKPPLEFEFKVTEPTSEDFTLRPPARDILQERPEGMATITETAAAEEIPNIQVSTNPAGGVAQEQMYIQSSQIAIDTPRIEIGGTETSISDAPQEISQVSETVTWPIQVIGAVVTDAPADLFKYKDPTPRDKVGTHFIAMAPAPGRPVKMMPRAWGPQDLVGAGQLGTMNINLRGTGTLFRPLSRYGEQIRARTSVDSALHWLALHQGADGLWHAEDLDGDKSTNLACTAFAVLAFGGAGNTINRGDYRRNVLRGVEALMREMDPEGGYYRKTTGNHGGYTQAICTIALCEAYGRARDERVGLAAQKAVSRCEKAVSPDGGWRYTPNSPVSDMSVTAWFIQALKTAKLAQLKFDNAIYSQALAYVDSVTDKGGSKDSSGAVTYQPQADQVVGGNGHPALTSAAMMVRQFTHTLGVKNHLLIKGAELTRKLPPTWNNKDFYYWYYATYAMHNMGGEYRLWWNKRIRDVLLENQCRVGENAGSWDPESDKWGARGAGRIYCTALGALCLEVYYRYSEALTSFGTAPELDELFFEEKGK